MRFISLALAFFAALVAAQEEVDVVPPEISVVASFPEDNPFGHVTNGERNKMSVSIENTSEYNVTVIGVGGSFHKVETDALIKNTTGLTYGVYLIPGAKITVPYSFHSELKPGETRLHIWIDHAVSGTKYRVTAYDSIVTIVEAPLSIFDWKLVSTYIITLGLIGALGYFAYDSFFPASSTKPKARKPKPQSISSPVGTVTATGAGGYQEEWIPAHHLKKTKGAKGNRSDGGASSGDELSKKGKKKN
ncbi:hypothetical protein SISNIDRAFT_486529 [Sistotremastrum niveocremeum HHB9708]|uniref:Translocon-associated protein subunit alpha n=2 Tax=Sistotremastraceae TaxID=3402574 RepID=A0A164TMX1_9AGAM|nr:hypothetical protein SISNIDRAFT_486529 [Sistotremastrum niveocremeum HHB9708]KZT42168.1 hypothetical protein SISSUDRAFT_1030671 [Sistotremastrum suecicum HHB10207 ss-3]